jgi:hypothetical protein
MTHDDRYDAVALKSYLKNLLGFLQEGSAVPFLY